MELFDLEQLSAFADCGTLSAAAKKLHLSQPTLTKTMKRLEEEFQVPLFVRRKNKLELNENGILAAAKAHQLLADRDVISLNEMDGENILLFSDIGFWHDVVTAHMPHSRFLIQTQRYDFNELTRSSILPYFATDITLRFSGVPDDRVVVSLRDDDATVQYHAVCFQHKAILFKELFC